MRATIITLLLGVFFALPAWGQAANDWTACDGGAGASPSTNVGVGDILCLECDESWGTAGVGATAAFNIVASSGSVCLMRDTATTAGSAAIQVQWCVPGSTVSDNTCSTIDTISTDSCNSYSRGLYRLNVSTAVTAGQDAKAEIRGY